jgi:hypothetical protein
MPSDSSHSSCWWPCPSSPSWLSACQCNYIQTWCSVGTAAPYSTFSPCGCHTHARGFPVLVGAVKAVWPSYCGPPHHTPTSLLGPRTLSRHALGATVRLCPAERWPSSLISVTWPERS